MTNWPYLTVSFYTRSSSSLHLLCYNYQSVDWDVMLEVRKVKWTHAKITLKFTSFPLSAPPVCSTQICEVWEEAIFQGHGFMAFMGWMKNVLSLLLWPSMSCVTHIAVKGTTTTSLCTDCLYTRHMSRHSECHHLMAGTSTSSAGAARLYNACAVSSFLQPPASLRASVLSNCCSGNETCRNKTTGYNHIHVTDVFSLDMRIWGYCVASTLLFPFRWLTVDSGAS